MYSLKVSRDGSRVFLIETLGLRPLVRKATIWEPDSARGTEVGKDGPGGPLGVPTSIQRASDGFWVWYPGTLVLLSKDGEPVDIVERPPLREIALRGVREDRSFIALNRLPPPAVSLGWTSGVPVSERQALHLSGSGSDWRQVPIAVVSMSNYLLGVRTDDGKPGPTPFGFLPGATVQ